MLKVIFVVFLILISPLSYSGTIKDADIARDAFHYAKYEKAFKLFKALAESDEAPEQFYLAEMFKNGYGVDKDKNKARKWYAKAANRGITTKQAADHAYEVRRRLHLDEIASDEKAYKQKHVSASKALQKKEREEIKLAKAKRLAAEEQRKSTPEYKQREAIKTISDAKFRINSAQKAIDHERRIGDRTGYVNATLIHGAGSYVVAYEDVINQAYKEYRQAGGKLKLKDIK